MRIQEVDGLELVKKFSEDMETMLHRKVEAVKVLRPCDLGGGGLCPAHHTKMTLKMMPWPCTPIILFLPHEHWPSIPRSQKVLVKEETMESKGRGRAGIGALPWRTASSAVDPT